MIIDDLLADEICQKSTVKYEVVSYGRFRRGRSMCASNNLVDIARFIKNVAARDYGALVAEITKSGHVIGRIDLRALRQAHSL